MRIIYFKKVQYATILGLLLLISVFQAHGQNQVLSLRDALTAADKNYPTLKARMSYIQAAEQSVKEARRAYIPSLRLIEQITYATSNSLPGTYFSYGASVSGSIATKQLDNPNFGAISALSAEWPVYTFGQQQARVDIARNEKKLAENALLNERFELSVRTASAYFDLLALVNLRISQEKNLERANSIRNIIISSTKTGLKPGVDSSTANAEVSKAKMALIDAQRNEQLQRNYLNQLLGNNGQTIVPDTVFLQKLPPVVISGTNNGGTSPIINYYLQRENLSHSREIFIRRSYLPRISILGEAWGRGSGISPESGNPVDPGFAAGTDLTRFNYALGIGAVFNITDYPRNSAAANAVRYQTLGLHEETNEQKMIQQRQIRDADDFYNTSYKKALESPVLVGAANTSYQQKLAMYNAGLTNFTDLAQALYNLNNAETEYAISYNSVWKALLYKTIPTGDISILLKQL